MAPLLGYWKIRGLAQHIRLILAQAGVEFEEKLYTERQKWLDEKFKMGFDFPNLPYFSDGDVKLTQSFAITKYLARKHGLDASNEKERQSLDMLDGVWIDMKTAFARMCYSPDFETLKVDYLEGLPLAVKQLAGYLGSKKWLTGDKLIYIDIMFYELLDCIKQFEPNCLKEHKNLQDLLKRVEELPNIAKFMKSDKFIKSPMNGPMAKFGNE